MARILRGDIRWAYLNPTRGHEWAESEPPSAGQQSGPTASIPPPSPTESPQQID
jgi:hypothetical protein